MPKYDFKHVAEAGWFAFVAVLALLVGIAGGTGIGVVIK